MNAREAARVRHTRTVEDVADTWLRARLRRERRLRAYMAVKDWPTHAMWRALDLLHEATNLVDKLEEKMADTQDRAAEQAWEAARA